MKHPILITAALAAALPAVPAVAQVGTATAANPGDPAARPFIDGMIGEGFGVLHDKSLSKAAARAKFRAILTKNVALDDIGMRLIRRLLHTPQATSLSWASAASTCPAARRRAWRWPGPPTRVRPSSCWMTPSARWTPAWAAC